MWKFNLKKILRQLKYSSILLLFVSPLAYSDQAQTIQALLDSFGSTCSIQDTQSRRLNDAAMNLSHTLEVAIYSDECKGFGSVATNVRGILDRLAADSPQYTGKELDYEAAIAQRNSLVAAIASETNPTAISTLKYDLQSTQVSIAKLSSEIVLSEHNNRNQRLLDAARSYQSSADVFLNTLAQNEQCLVRHPSLLEGMSAVGLALAQSSTLAISTGGASVLAGAGIFTVSRVIQFMKDKKNQKLLKSITDPLLPSALSCAMENLNEIYCESDGVEKLGTFVLSPQYRLQSMSNSDVFQGLELLEKAVPALDNTLSLIKVGTEPSSGIDGMQRSGINTLKALLQGTKARFAGLLNDLRKSVQAIDPGVDPQSRRNQIFSEQKAFIDNFLNSVGIYSSQQQMSSSGMSSGGDSSPLAAIYKDEFARFYLMGFDVRKMNFKEQGAVTFDTLLIEGAHDPANDPWKKYALGDETHFFEDIGQFQARVKNRFEKWFNEAQIRLDTKANLILKTDKKEILASLDEPLSRDSKITPIVALQKLSSFLTSPASQRYLKFKYKRIAYEVADVLDGIMNELNSISFDLPEDQFQAKVNEVFGKILVGTHYTDDSRFLISRLSVIINSIISQASIELYQSGNSDMIYSLASADVVKELRAYSGKQKSTVDMINDAKKVKGQLIPTFAAFVDVFRDALEKNLVLLAKPENKIRRALERGHLCLQLLGLDQNFKSGFFSKDFIKDVVIPNCEGATMPPIPGTPSAPVVTRDLWRLPTEERICLHQKWRRKLSIFEKNIGN